MAGHSKWANIKHRKARQDAARGRLWSKIARAIIVAAKQGGPDPAANVQLRYAIEDAKAANMPKDTIERNIKKGAGETGGDDYEHIRYEGYGAGGVAFIVDCLTDNRNRTAPELRTIFGKHGGSLGVTGSVAYLFEPKGVVQLAGETATEEQVMEAAIDAGAEDVRQEDGAWVVHTPPDELFQVQQALEAAGLRVESAGLTMLPLNTVEVRGAEARRVLQLVEALEEHDDVQKVHANFEIPDEEMAQLAAES